MSSVKTIIDMTREMMKSPISEYQEHRERIVDAIGQIHDSWKVAAMRAFIAECCDSGRPAIHGVAVDTLAACDMDELIDSMDTEREVDDRMSIILQAALRWRGKP